MGAAQSGSDDASCDMEPDVTTSFEIVARSLKGMTDFPYRETAREAYGDSVKSV